MHTREGITCISEILWNVQYHVFHPCVCCIVHFGKSMKCMI